jgi:hypothetical protein
LKRSVSYIGAFGKVRWTEGKVSSCTIIPITIAEDGEPVEATEECSSVLLSRLNSLSQDYGTGFELVKLTNGFEINITSI